MPGKAQPGAPRALFRVVTVDDRHRLFLPAGIREVVSWLAGGTIDCTAYVVGEGVGLVPPDRDELRGRLDDVLTERRLKPDDAATRLGDLVRWAATSWPVSIDSQLRLTLPEDARKLGLLPQAGQRAAVFAAGDVVEIWPAEAWRRTMADLSRVLPRLAEEALGDRE